MEQIMMYRTKDHITESESTGAVYQVACANCPPPMWDRQAGVLTSG